jgi:tetratricopeptide (TPR) repeat protein
MNHKPFASILSQVVQGEIPESLPAVEAAAIQHPGWAAPVATLAVAAEKIGDWESAFELWSQAHALVPDSEKIGDSVRRASLILLRKAAPDKHSAVVHDESAENERWGPTKEKVEPVGEESTGGPTPMVAPLDFDLTEFAAGEAFAPASEPDVPEPATDASTAIDELDELIGRLEGARIVPRQDVEAIPTPDLSADIDDVASETLAAIYMSQQQFSEAARVYERLADQHPDKAEEFLEKAHAARARVSE